MARKPMPAPDVPIIDPLSGKLTTTWYEYFRSRDALNLSDLRDVDAAGIVNGEVLVWTAASGKFEPGAN